MVITAGSAFPDPTSRAWRLSVKVLSVRFSVLTSRTIRAAPSATPMVNRVGLAPMPLMSLPVKSTVAAPNTLKIPLDRSVVSPTLRTVLPLISTSAVGVAWRKVMWPTVLSSRLFENTTPVMAVAVPPVLVSKADQPRMFTNSELVIEMSPPN